MTNTCTGQVVASQQLNGLRGTNGKICLPDEAYEFKIYDIMVIEYAVSFKGEVVASGEYAGEILYIVRQNNVWILTRTLTYPICRW